LSQQFDEIVAREARGFLPVVKRLPVAIAEGRGSRVRDVDGNELVDLTAGWGVCAIGHCHPRLVGAIGEQAGRLMQTTNLFYTLPQLDLIERLRAVAPAELTRSFFVSSGAEAMDGALKLAHRATGRTKFVSTAKSFHGRTLGSLAIIGQEKHRAPYQRMLQEGCFVPFGDLDAARRAIDDNTAAFVVEPVQGEGGVNVAPPGYLAGLRQLTREAGALLVLDEIQTGIGRTGKWLALEWDAVVPDVVTLGKGLGGGFPVAAFLCSEDVAKTVSLGDHGGTYAGNPLACAAANAVLDVIDEDGLVENAAAMGERLRAGLEAIVRDEAAPAAVEARGIGLLRGIRLADGVDARDALGRLRDEHRMLASIAGGTVLRLAPPLNVTAGEIDEALARFGAALRELAA
jgi:acetylornithine/N-succinyldiaminopimelate aminotransferase